VAAYLAGRGLSAPSASSAELLLHLWLLEGARGCAGVDGEFALASGIACNAA